MNSGRRHVYRRTMKTNRRIRQRAAALGSGALLLALSPLYVWRPDAAAAVTLLPAAFWWVLGLAAGLFALPDRRASAVLVGGWALFGIAFVEELRSPLRPGFRIRTEARAPGAELRVASLNCAGGLWEAAQEVGAYRPDVVLFQETVGRDQLRRLAAELYGEDGAYLAGPDGSIVMRGRLREVPVPRGTHNFVMADAQVGGRSMQLVSLRLLPPVGRVDLWNPNCWRDQKQNRVARREELEEILRFVRAHRRTVPLIIGGDFNAVAGDASLRPIGFLIDSFDAAGRGLGNTAVNDYPFARIDRIFVSSDVRVLASTVRKTRHSDHRMLIVDLAFR
jgi:vancomycin resistance protein VanJ